MTRHKQPKKTLWEGMVSEDVHALWEPWMVEADTLLDDEELLERVYQAQGSRHERSHTRGRPQTPAEIVLRLLLLKHVRNWSYDVLEREVRANLVYRDFSRVGLNKVSRQILNDTRRVIAEVKHQADKSKRRLQPLARAFSATAGRVRQVIRQTRARIFAGITQSADKIVSLFEPHTEIIRKGKASKPTEFGKLVQIQEAENQIVTHYEVFEHRPSDRELLTAAVEAHERVLKRVPRLVAADAGFWSQKQEQSVREKGVRWISVPNRATKSADRKALERSQWFKKAQAWRTGCEGRISVLKRRHGLSRCRYRGLDGMKRWVGLGVIADNLINIGSAMAVSRP